MPTITPPIPSLISYLPDVVAIYNSSNIQVFKQARPISVSVRPNSKLMEHPLETGETVIDHRVIYPTEIEIVLILVRNDYYNLYQTIKQFYDAGTLLKIQTRSSIYKNQVIYELPHDETVEFFNTIQITLKLKEVLYSNSGATNVVPFNPTDSSLVTRGAVQVQPLPDNVNPVIRSLAS